MSLKLDCVFMLCVLCVWTGTGTLGNTHLLTSFILNEIYLKNPLFNNLTLPLSGHYRTHQTKFAKKYPLFSVWINVSTF